MRSPSAGGVFALKGLAPVVLWAAFFAAAQETRAQDSTESTNLLPNPSFENGEKAPRGWESRSWGNTEKHASWKVTPGGRTGRCVTILSTDDKGADAAWTATIKVEADTFYRLSGWIKTRDVRGATGALFNIQNLQHVKTPAVRGTHDWRRVSTLFRTGEEPAELEINCLFGGWGASTGQAWYDDVAVEPMDRLSERREAELTIATDGPKVTYSRMIFGGFIEHFHRQIYGGLVDPESPLSDERGFRTDVIEAMKELRLSVVRWPGGCFASGYRWKKGVGRNRKPFRDVVWGVKDPNTFGTIEFVEWCRLVGCEPYICTNAGSGTPEEMREWVEYCNGTNGALARWRRDHGYPAPLDVQFWSIGNENWGAHEIGARTPEQWGPLVLESAKMMLGVDPEISLVAAATPDPSWTLPLLAAAGPHLDFVAIHKYWLPCWGQNLTPDYLSCILLSEGPETTIRKVIALLDESGCRRRIKIAFDEWNLRGWHHPGFPRKNASDPDHPAVIEQISSREKNAIASQYTMADALFSASFLNSCLRHAQDVGMANIAPIVNTRGPLYVHPGGIVRRTTFHTLAMYANELESRVGTMDLESGMLVHGSRFIPLVDAIATVDESSTNWSIALINRHPAEEVACTLRMKDVLPQGAYPVTVLTSDSPDAYNDVARPRRVAPEKRKLVFEKGVARLPPHSLSIVRMALP